MTTKQKRERKAAATALAEANEFVGEAVEKIKRRRGDEPWPCTKQDIEDARDARGLSWRAVAAACGLAGPSQARKAYAELTGRSHKESTPIVKRAKRGTGGKAVVDSVGWDDDTDQAVIEAALLGVRHQDDKGNVWWTHKAIEVERDRYVTLPGEAFVEEILCRYATAFTYGPNGDQPLQVEFVNDQGAHRTVFVSKIRRVVG